MNTTQTATLFALLVLLPASASAHVYLASPQDGEVIEPASSYSITWEIAVNHGPPDTYDLMFSRDGGRQFQMVAEGLGSVQNEFLWTAPDESVPEAVLAIVQHGASGYTYMHEVYFVIGDGGTGTPDMGSGSSPDAGELFAPPDAQMAVTEEGGVPSTGEEVGDLLAMRCGITGCHAAQNPQAGLDLTKSAFPDSLANADSTQQSGAKLVAICNPSSSELLARLRGERALRMPPPPEMPFSDAQIASLQAWINSGAPATGAFDANTCSDEVPADNPIGDDAEDDGGCATTSSSTTWWLVLGMLLVGFRRRLNPTLRSDRRGPEDR